MLVKKLEIKIRFTKTLAPCIQKNFVKILAIVKAVISFSLKFCKYINKYSYLLNPKKTLTSIYY